MVIDQLGIIDSTLADRIIRSDSTAFGIALTVAVCVLLLTRLFQRELALSRANRSSGRYRHRRRPSRRRWQAFDGFTTILLVALAALMILRFHVLA
jgi:uncharacterized protein HemY